MFVRRLWGRDFGARQERRPFLLRTRASRDAFLRSAVKSLAARRVVALLCCLSLGAAAIGPDGSLRPSPVRQVPEQPIVFGHSVQNRPLRAFVLGWGPGAIMIFGGFHGNERSGPGVVERLRAYLQQHPAARLSPAASGCAPISSSIRISGWAAGSSLFPTPTLTGGRRGHASMPTALTSAATSPARGRRPQRRPAVILVARRLRNPRRGRSWDWSKSSLPQRSSASISRCTC